MTTRAIFVLLMAGSAAFAADETRLVYRLRGEVRPLLFWIGRDDVGGGHISIRRSPAAAGRWREEIEVLFGSAPDRIPGRVNRWGYGRETAEWTRESGAPRLLATEFQGMMRHSPESSLAEVRAQTPIAAAYRFDVTRSVVSTLTAFHEFRVFSDAADFQYRDPGRLLARYRDCLSEPPLRRAALSNDAGRWTEPNGFLTAVRRLVDVIVADPQRPRPAAAFVFNSRLYTLAIRRVRLVGRGVAVLEFDCFNTVKRTRTAFTIWTPLDGDLKGLPVRIALQPRWWLRLRLDLASQTP